MQTALVCLCLCLLSTALATPVSMAFPGLPACCWECEKIVGFGYFLPHQILVKGCNARHGFYMFEYVYSLSTRRNQTQIK
ncbi:OC116 protein, partial [Picathartes gymnocephalus]|nr:OC116 protein [Picathartes gymnocephalus]